MEREDYKVLPLALIGLVQGVFRYYVVAPMVDKAHRYMEERIPSQEELDALITELAVSDP